MPVIEAASQQQQTTPAAATALIHPVILSGGSGTRLWPLSRSGYPKQLHPLTSERTLLQETVARGAGLDGYADPILICNEQHRFLVEGQLREAGLRAQQIILEPAGRNTAPAIAAAALWLMARDPEALMLIQPSDHAIGLPAAFRAAVTKGAAAARAGWLVTFGIQPTHPEVGYGYIQADQPIALHDGVRAIDRFVEKPDRETAQRFVESGRFFWNGGIFLFGARHFVEELQRLHPAMLQACHEAVSKGNDHQGCHLLHGEAFAAAAALSVDRAVMEHTDRAAVVPVDMAWSDVGSWRALRDVGTADACGNVVRGDVLLEDVHNSYIRSEDKLVAAIGLDDIIVVNTDDAVLVAKADRSAEVGNLVEMLRQRNRSEPHQHRTVHRPWGHYRSTDMGERFQVKRIVVKPGAQLSLQKHYHRAEHWIVVQGTAEVQIGEERRLVRENESVYIPIGTQHRLGNPGKIPVHLIEVQLGAYLGEDDIVRLADTYGRV